MKNIIYSLIITATFLSCTTTKTLINKENNETSYMIKKIQKLNSWYLIYAEKNGTVYKIVSKIDSSFTGDCNRIKIGKQYELALKARKENAPVINGVKLAPLGYTGCFQFDEETTICLEPKKGIYDIFYTDDLKGLCFLK